MKTVVRPLFCAGPIDFYTEPQRAYVKVTSHAEDSKPWSAPYDALSRIGEAPLVPSLATSD
jgi:ABC-type thiamine transport system substrate-binding protein